MLLTSKEKMSATPEKSAEPALPEGSRNVPLVRCAGCGAENPGRRKYCGKCGGNLWEPCICCGEVNSAGEEFCGSCGGNLKIALQERAEQIEEDILRGENLRKEYRYREAINLLKPASAAHSRLAPAVNKAKELLDRCFKEQQELTVKIRQIEHEVQQLLAVGDTARAGQRAGEIPESLRSEEMRTLLEESQSCEAEIASLSEDISRAKEGPLTIEQINKVARLLTLQPYHEEAVRQAQAINRGAIRKSRRVAQASDFDKALNILDQVPPVFHDEDFRRFREQISDLAYWAWDLQHAPRLDSVLFEFGRRVRKNASVNEKLADRCKELERQESRFQPGAWEEHQWCAGPPTPLLGAKMEFLTALGQIHIAEKGCESAWAENSGRFAAAYGLALQGLGRAALAINLLPEESWLGKIGRWMPKRRAQTAWGIEISSSGIKAVKLALEKNNNIVLQTCHLIEHRRLLNQSANDKDRNALLDETLQNFLQRHDLGDEPVVLGLPDWMVLLKIAELPPMPLAKREGAIAHEARHLFTVPLPDLVWKHALLTAAEKAASQERPLQVVYAGVRRSLLQDYIARWQKLGLRADEVQCDALALYNFAMFGEVKESIKDSITKQTDNKFSVALVDLGADRLNILVCSRQRFWLRSIMLGSDRINRALVRQFKLTHQQAEQWKRNPALAPSAGRLYETLLPVYEDYFQETLDALASYQNAYPGEKNVRILGCGGGFAAHDLPRYFLWRR